jgi:hypothetical protein
MSVPGPDPRDVATPTAKVAGDPWRRGRRSLTERLGLATEIVAAYVHARRALRKTPIATVVASLRSAEDLPVNLDEADTLHEARSLGWAVTRLLSHLPGDTRCLIRSLVLTRLLARRGIPAKVVIGARSGPDFLAHAWVEYAGDPVLDPGDGSFGRLVEI